MKNWFDHIEEYLNNELSATDKLAMEKAMKTDDNLRAEVALAKLMVEAIEKTGEIELRQFLKENTNPHATKKPLLKYLVAAGSIAAMLLCGIFIYNAYKPNNNEQLAEKNYFGFDDSLQSDQDLKINPNTIAKNENNEPVLPQNHADESSIAVMDESGGTDSSVSKTQQYQSDAKPNKGRFYLAQTTYAPINIVADEYDDYNQAPQIASNASGYGTREKLRIPENTNANSRANTDTLSKQKEVVKTTAADDVTTFIVSYYESSNTNIEITCKTGVNKTILVEAQNLDPNSGLIVQHIGNYYLKSGTAYYLLNLTGSVSEQAKVKNTRLLAVLNQQSNATPASTDKSTKSKTKTK